MSEFPGLSKARVDFVVSRKGECYGGYCREICGIVRGRVCVCVVVVVYGCVCVVCV